MLDISDMGVVRVLSLKGIVLPMVDGFSSPILTTIHSPVEIVSARMLKLLVPVQVCLHRLYPISSFSQTFLVAIIWCHSHKHNNHCLCNITKIEQKISKIATTTTPLIFQNFHFFGLSSHSFVFFDRLQCKTPVGEASLDPVVQLGTPRFLQWGGG